jgi:hypothetical protein
MAGSYIPTGTRGRLHLVPDVASDTFALIAATQTLTNKTLTSPTITGPTLTGGVSLTGTGNISQTDTITGASATTRRATYVKLTLTPATTQEVAAGGSLAAIRGEINQTTGKIFTDGFLYGVQGKSVFAGTMAEVSAARLTGVLGQTDISGATITLGQVSAVWADLQGTSPTLTVNDQVYVLRVTNSMNVSAQAFLLTYGKCDYFLEAGASGNTADWYATAGTGANSAALAGGGIASKVLKVNVMGTDYWIPLFSSNSN